MFFDMFRRRRRIAQEKEIELAKEQMQKAARETQRKRDYLRRTLEQDHVTILIRRATSGRY